MSPLGRRVASFNLHVTNRLTAPQVMHDERRRYVPAPVRPVLRLLGVDEFLRLDQPAFV